MAVPTWVKVGRENEKLCASWVQNLRDIALKPWWADPTTATDVLFEHAELTRDASRLAFWNFWWQERDRGK